MHEWLMTVILGLIEGITEFMPVSSTGHLLIVQKFMHDPRPELFDVGIQAGAILAVVFIYWKKLTDLAINWHKPENLDFLKKCGTAFILTCIFGLLSRKLGFKLDDQNVIGVGAATLIGAFFIFWAESKLSKLNHAQTSGISWLTAIIVGIAQVLAGIFPGLSRSGTTIITGMFLGNSRANATEFSFILGIPTMFAATGYLLIKEFKSGHHHLPMVQWLHLGLGFFVSMVVAFIVVKWLLQYVRGHSFTPFAWYRIILGALILIFLR
jgi:undecaprenyl-diphosphatase